MEKVFIVGCDRSGTTMLASMIGSFTNTTVLPEAQFISDFLNLNRSNDFVNIGVEFKNFVIKHNRYKLWEKKLNAESWKLVVEENDINSIYEKFVKEYDKSNVTKRSVDHTPCNINSVHLINQYLDDCKFIFLYRDPRAVASSLMKSDWGPNDIIGCTNKWLSTTAKGLCYEKSNYDKEIISIKYEKIVNKDDFELSRISNYLKEKNTKVLLNTDGFCLPKYNSKTHEILGKGLNSDRINSWKKNLTEREIEICENLCGEVIECLEYEKTYKNPLMATPMEKIKYIIIDSYKNIVNRFLKYKRNIENK